MSFKLIFRFPCDTCRVQHAFDCYKYTRNLPFIWTKVHVPNRCLEFFLKHKHVPKPIWLRQLLCEVSILFMSEWGGGGVGLFVCRRISEVKNLISFIQHAFDMKEKSIINMYLTFWSLEHLEIIASPCWMRLNKM